MVIIRPMAVFTAMIQVPLSVNALSAGIQHAAVIHPVVEGFPAETPARPLKTASSAIIHRMTALAAGFTAGIPARPLKTAQ